MRKATSMRWICPVSVLLLSTAPAYAQEQGAAGVRLGDPVVVEVLDENASSPPERQRELTLPNTSGPNGPFTVEGIGDNSARTTEGEADGRPEPAPQETVAAPAPVVRTRPRGSTERAATQRAVPSSPTAPEPTRASTSLPAEPGASEPEDPAPQGQALPAVAPAPSETTAADLETSAASTWSTIAIASSILLLLLFAGLAFAVWRMIRNGRVIPSSVPYRAQDGAELPALLRPPKSQPGPPAALPSLGHRGPEPEKPAPKAAPPKDRPPTSQPQAASSTPMFNYSLTAPRMVDPRKSEKA